MTEADPYARLAGVYDDFVVDPCFAQWADLLEALWGLDDSPVNTVLDVGCGTGRMAAELVDRGYAVTGVDASEAMLRIARERVGGSVALHLRRLPDLSLPDRSPAGRFDAAISTYDALNYLSGAAFAETLLHLARVIRPRGWLVFDLHSDAMFDLAIANPHVLMEHEGFTVDIRYETDPNARTCTSHLILSDGQRTMTEAHPQFIHASSTVLAALASAGFDSATVLDNYSMRSADEATLRATWVARRS